LANGITTDGETRYPRQNPIVNGIKGRCPRCGAGRLFQGFLGLPSNCPACGLNFAFVDSGDGPAVFVILVVGFLVAGAALLVEIAYAPPIWVHLAVWMPLVLILCLGLLRPLKGVLVALQYHHRAGQGRLGAE
jgi:uncharacterized protein (DUF983 family)